ncbi:MAG TPA: hypothetical protein VEU08_16670, partial [Vicinamibacterales bacterium]|nr:hypothetical protein [Vicinamibacterales bacterium]
VDARISRIAQPRRISFTLPQLAAAAAVLIAVSGGAAWEVGMRSADHSVKASRSDNAAGTNATPESEASAERSQAERPAPAEMLNVSPSTPMAAKVSFADAQYDAAVSDLEKTLKSGRTRLDKSTIAIVEHNLQIIDQAIEQARQALEGDPANSYLSGHLVEARRRKLDLLRRAAALTNETD